MNTRVQVNISQERRNAIKKAVFDYNLDSEKSISMSSLVRDSIKMELVNSENSVNIKPKDLVSITVSMDKETKKEAKIAAFMADITLKQWITNAIEMNISDAFEHATMGNEEGYF